jgi:hypothetical protein
MQGFDILPFLDFGASLALAALMLYIYRQDRQASEERLEVLLNRYNELAKQMIALVETTTRAISALDATIKADSLVDKLNDLELRLRQQKGG